MAAAAPETASSPRPALPLARLGLVSTEGSDVELFAVEDDHTLTPTWLRFPAAAQAEGFLDALLAAYQVATSQPFPTAWLLREDTSDSSEDSHADDPANDA